MHLSNLNRTDGDFNETFLKYIFSCLTERVMDRMFRKYSSKNKLCNSGKTCPFIVEDKTNLSKCFTTPVNEYTL